MKKLINLLFSLLIIFAVFSCKKNKVEMSDLDKLRNSNNKKSYPAVQMDSLQAIKSITLQKTQEVMDLANLYRSGKRNTQIDSAIYTQMESYFHKPDSLTFRKMFSEMDSLKVKDAKVNQLDVFKEIIGKDTIDYAKFNVEYFDHNKKSIGKFEKFAQYILVSIAKPQNPQKEFKFYFLNFYTQPVKDTTSVGSTR